MGPIGPAGTTVDATNIVCKAGKVIKGKVKVSCKVKLAAASASTARVYRGKQLYARGHVSGKTLRLRSGRNLAPGEYRLVLVSGSITITQTLTIR